MPIARKFAAYGGIAFVLAVALAATLVACTRAVPLLQAPATTTPVAETPTMPPPDGYAWTLEDAVATMEARRSAPQLAATPEPAATPEATPTTATTSLADFYVVRIPTKGQFSEPVRCRHRGERESFSVRYLHATVPFEEWQNPDPDTKRSTIGRYGENVRVIHRPGPDSDAGEYDFVGTKIYVFGVPGQRVLVNAPPPDGYGEGSCFLTTLTDERAPPY